MSDRREGGLRDAVDTLARETGFSGVVRVDRGGEVELVGAYGLAHRGCGIANTPATRFGIASGTKGLTALAVVSLIDDGVTVELLLAHRSGIGDYLDEEAADAAEQTLAVPVQELATTEQYLAVLDGHPTKFPPGERFSYSNGGYVVLALIAERVSGVPFHELVRARVCEPAGMRDTEFLRSDELPGSAARGYLPIEDTTGPSLRTNVFHLPVRGSGDGGIYSTVADVASLWSALFAGAIVPAAWVRELVRPRSDVPAESKRYGLGFWLHPTTGAVSLEGHDHGVSFRSVHDPDARLTHTVVSNTADGAWPLTRRLDQVLGG